MVTRSQFCALALALAAVGCSAPEVNQDKVDQQTAYDAAERSVTDSLKDKGENLAYWTFREDQAKAAGISQNGNVYTVHVSALYDSGFGARFMRTWEAKSEKGRNDFWRVVSVRDEGRYAVASR